MKKKAKKRGSVIINRPTTFEETCKAFKLSKKRIKYILELVDEVLGKRDRVD